MIGRVWHGWTTPENADVYEGLLRSEIFPGIAGREIPGFQGIQLFRRPAGAEVEFMTVMWFETLDAVKQFEGEDYETAHVPDKARRVLARFDATSKHYEVKESLDVS